MFIKTNNFFFWKLLNIKNIVFCDDGVDLSKCHIKKINNLNYKEAIKYFIDIQNFIELIEKYNFTLNFIDENDFLIINGNLTLVNHECITELDNNNYFTICKTLEIKKYVPPEFKFEIPIKLYKSFCYYQLCSIIKNNLLLQIGNIKHTPLYYSIIRGLIDNPLKRFLIII